MWSKVLFASISKWILVLNEPHTTLQATWIKSTSLLSAEKKISLQD